MSISEGMYGRFYPDLHKSGTRFFYEVLRGTIGDGQRVLNVGAGPGDLPTADIFRIRDLRGATWKVYGCDPDTAVLVNCQVDEACVMESGGTIPFQDEFFDVVFADYVLEHVESPRVFLGEIFRVLKVGGRFHFRTPNLLHYVSLAARTLPHWIHHLWANKARGLPEGTQEPYRTFHRMNTTWTLRKLASEAGFHNIDLVMFEGEPFYLAFNSGAFLVGVAYERIVNRFEALKLIRANVIGSMVK